MSKTTHTYRVRGNNLLVEVIPEKAYDSTVITVVTEAKKETFFGRVISLGEDVYEIAPGDVVGFGQFSGTQVDIIPDKEMRVIRDADILVIRDTHISNPVNYPADEQMELPLEEGCAGPCSRYVPCCGDNS